MAQRIRDYIKVKHHQLKIKVDESKDDANRLHSEINLQHLKSIKDEMKIKSVSKGLP